MKMRRNGFWNRGKCFRMNGTPTVGVQLSWESTCFATKQVKSHKCRIWCPLRGPAWRNQPLNWTEGGRKITLNGAVAVVRSSSECADRRQSLTLRLTAAGEKSRSRCFGVTYEFRIAAEFANWPTILTSVTCDRWVSNRTIVSTWSRAVLPEPIDCSA